MTGYFIRLILGLLMIGVISGIAYFFNIDWLKVGKPEHNLYLLFIVIIGEWVGIFIRQVKKGKIILQQRGNENFKKY
ncbi:hypothetical protein ACE38V_12855 [Cytobacillus sp. Hz8]|uniref:hypothetical protein n=1 Tax=Cytobacillus sp. Hz8 TaxID=3347168 RepID=UPI0035D61439